MNKADLRANYMPLNATSISYCIELQRAYKMALAEAAVKFAKQNILVDDKDQSQLASAFFSYARFIFPVSGYTYQA